MDIISEHKILMSCFAILLTLFLIIIAGWKIEDYTRFEKEKEKQQNNEQNELVEKINYKNNELKNYINEILKDHANRIHFITSVLIENNVDRATLEILHKRLKDEDLKKIGFSDEKIMQANQYQGKLSIKDLQTQA